MKKITFVLIVLSLLASSLASCKKGENSSDVSADDSKYESFDVSINTSSDESSKSSLDESFETSFETSSEISTDASYESSSDISQDFSHDASSSEEDISAENASSLEETISYKYLKSIDRTNGITILNTVEKNGVIRKMQVSFKGNKGYSSSEMISPEGTQITRSIVSDGKTYYLYDDSKTYEVFDYGSAKDTFTAEQFTSDLNYINTTVETVNGVKYIVDNFKTKSGNQDARFYCDKNGVINLVFMANDIAKFEIVEGVEDSIFQIPSDYTEKKNQKPNENTDSEKEHGKFDDAADTQLPSGDKGETAKP